MNSNQLILSQNHNKPPVTLNEQLEAIQEMCLDDEIKAKLKKEVDKVVFITTKKKEQKKQIEARKLFLLQNNPDETMLMLDATYKNLIYVLSLIEEQCNTETEALNQKAYFLLASKYQVLSSQYAEISSLMLDTLKTSKDFIKLIEKKPKYVKFLNKIKYHLKQTIPFPSPEVEEAVERKYNKYAIEIAMVYRRYVLKDDKEVTTQRLDEIAPFSLELNLDDVMGVLANIGKINNQVLIPIEQEYAHVYATHHLRFTFIEAYKKKIQSILNTHLKEIQGKTSHV